MVANGIASDPVAVTVGTRDCFFLVDRSTFAQGEIQALINLNGAPATIPDALFVVVEGFSRDQIGRGSVDPEPGGKDLVSPERSADSAGSFTAVISHPAVHVSVSGPV